MSTLHPRSRKRNAKPKFWEQTGEPPTLSDEARETIAFTRSLNAGDRIEFSAKRKIENSSVARYPIHDLSGRGTVVSVFLQGAVMLAMDGEDADRPRFIYLFGRTVSKL